MTKKKLQAVDTKPYRGMCPIDSNQLEKSQDGIRLFCSVHPEHFNIERAKFESTWDQFDAGKMDGETLLKTLMDANTAKEKPTLSKWIVENE
jgi:hypothetical protein